MYKSVEKSFHLFGNQREPPLDLVGKKKLEEAEADE